MVNKKDRRHSGRYAPKKAGTILNSEKQDELTQLPEEEYDDWIERRDGMRYGPDKTHIRNSKMSCIDEEELRIQNEKIKRGERIRLIKKESKNGQK